VADAIASVAVSVDGFVLIESGGGDDAVRAANLAVAEHASHLQQHISNQSYGWTGSFSEARNYALRWARALGYDYAVTVDPDERVSLPDDLRQLLEQHPEADVCNVQDREQGYCKERVIRCASEGHWRGRVCENFFTHGKRARLGGSFVELPKSKEGEAIRWQRGVIECQRMIDEGDDYWKWYRHMGTCLAGLGRRDEAQEAYRMALAKVNEAEPKAWIRYLLCEQAVVDEKYEYARNLAATGLADHAGFLAEFGWILAYTAFKAGNLENASKWAQLVLSAPHDSSRVSFRGKKCITGANQLLGIMCAKATEIP
jgi:glycosyltransferase involved in cell wall biosynthesis